MTPVVAENDTRLWRSIASLLSEASFEDGGAGRLTLFNRATQVEVRQKSKSEKELRRKLKQLQDYQEMP